MVTMDYIETYKVFADKGTEGIIQFIGKNDSAENLKHKLLELYIDKIDFIISTVKKQNCTHDTMFDLLVKHPNEIKICKQLFTNRKNPEMNLVFLYSINSVKPIILSMLKSHFEISENIEYFNSMWMTMVELWCSELDINNLTANHMKDISEATAEIILKLNKL